MISRSEWHPFSIIQVPGSPPRAAFYAEAVGNICSWPAASRFPLATLRAIDRLSAMRLLLVEFYPAGESKYDQRAGNRRPFLDNRDA